MTGPTTSRAQRTADDVPWEIAVAGTVTLDDVTTPAGHRRDQVGGSAVYFALAAAPVTTVHLCGTVGADGLAAIRSGLAASGVRLDGLAVSDAPTYRWTATHDFDTWLTRDDEHSDEGAYGAWQPAMSAAAAAAPILFLGSMRPDLQEQVLAQSHARLIGADSMTVHIGSDAAAVRRVAEASDILFLNRNELATLTGEHSDDWERAARSLCGRGRLRAVVVKAGPDGAACVTASAVVHHHAHPVAEVIDPTGAGDSLAGGMLAACATARRAGDDYLGIALDAGLRRAADCIGAFGTDGLRAPRHQD